MNNDEDYRVVPLADLEALEAARLEVYAMFPGCNTNMSMKLQRITQPLWFASHRKYPTPTEHAVSVESHVTENPKCRSCHKGYDGTKGQGYQPCGCRHEQKI